MPTPDGLFRLGERKSLSMPDSALHLGRTPSRPGCAGGSLGQVVILTAITTPKGLMQIIRSCVLVVHLGDTARVFWHVL